AVGIHVVTAWIFATQGARGWWHSAVLAPDFIALAMASGTALVLLVCALAYGAGETTRQPYRILSLFIAVPFFIHLFFMYNDFVIEAWYGSSESLSILAITLRENLPAHVLEVLLPLTAVILLLSSRVRRSEAAVVSSCCLLMLGVVVHRFLLMPGAFNQIPMTIQPLGLQHGEWSLPMASGEYGPGLETFVTSWDYFPSPVELVIFLGALAFMACLVLLGTSRLPVVNQNQG
ncbi:MAG: polysulfide reductase NrfD, partial [Desulfohalobiaceae bacterium]|nr:polysulfide reductase NrfD [Desulfohalobiaceae bacterium]